MLEKDGETQGFGDISREEKPVEAIRPGSSFGMGTNQAIPSPAQPVPVSTPPPPPPPAPGTFPPTPEPRESSLKFPSGEQPKGGIPINVNKTATQEQFGKDKDEIETSLEEEGLGTTGTLAIMILAISLLTTVAFYALKVAKSSVLKAKQAQLAEAETTLSTPELTKLDEKAQNYKNALSVIDSAISGQTYYSNLLTELQIVTEKNVKLDSFSVTAQEVKIGGSTSTFGDLAKYMVSLGQSTRLTLPRLTTIGRGNEGTITFSITATLSPKALTKGQ